VETVGLVDDSESISNVIKFADVYEAFVKELTDIYDGTTYMYEYINTPYTCT